MPLQKNQLLTLRIERLSSDGSGVAHSPEGEAVFVPGTAPGDEAQVRIVKDCEVIYLLGGTPLARLNTREK